MRSPYDASQNAVSIRKREQADEEILLRIKITDLESRVIDLERWVRELRVGKES